MTAKINQSEKIRRMVSDGKSYSEVSKKLNIRYQTVWRTMNRDKGLIIKNQLLLQKEEVSE